MYKLLIVEFIVPRLIRMIMEKQSLTEQDALTQLYNSELYITCPEEA